MLKRLTRLLYLFLLLYASASAQPYYFRHYQVENGLSNNTVFCSIQDKNGFMWFGTKDGLNRFDGYHFKTFNIKNEDESSFTHEQVSSLAMDKNNVLWVGSQKGLYWFDAEKERFVRFIDTLKNINDILIDKKGQLWFISDFTLCRYNFKQKHLTIFLSGNLLNITSICEAEDGSMWFSTTKNYVQQYKETTNSFLSYNVFSHSPPTASTLVEKIIADGHGSLYVGTSGQGIKKLNRSSSSYEDLLMYNADKTTIYVRDILQTKDDEFWFATESGLFILNAQTGSFINLKKKFLDPYSLSDNAVYTLRMDKEGGIWAGTYFGGLNYFPKQSVTFQKYFPDYSKNTISGSAVREICGDGFGNIWIGTEDAGLNKLNTKTAQFTHYKPTGSPSSIAYSNIHGLLVLGRSLWIGTFEHGLDVMDIPTGKVIKHYKTGTGTGDLKSNFIVSFLQTKGGSIYIGTSSCVMLYNPQKDNFSLVDVVPPHQFISCLIEDHNGTIWVSTHATGIYYFNVLTGEKGHFENIPGNKNSLTTNHINAIYEDGAHQIWFGTEGGGLCQLSANRKNFSRFTAADGLPSNFVFKILEDNRKTLWVTTSKGLVNLDLKHHSTKVYIKENGLLNDQFNYNSGYKDGEGSLYFGSVRGMITFKPDSFFRSNYVPPIFITGFQVENKEVDISKDSNLLPQSIVYARSITLPYNRSSFSLDFAAISYTSPEVTEYSYKMEGLDNDWTYIKSNRKVYFTNVEPGHYVFNVKAAVNGVWSKEVKKLYITITPPFWATGWAYLFYTLCTLLLAYLLIQSYHKKQMERKEKEIYEAKIEFFTNIAHEIKTPLTLIKGPVENLHELADKLPDIREDIVTMERNTNRLVNLINQVLDFRQTEIKGFRLDFAPTNLNEVLKEVYLTFEPVAKKRGLLYTIDLPANAVSIMADAEALHKVFSNLFSNAVKYADNTVSVRLLQPRTEDKYVAIEVESDGYVIPLEMKEKIFEPFFRLKETLKQKGTGIGLALARSLVELHAGKIYLKERSEVVNVFVVALPCWGLEPPAENLMEHNGPSYLKRILNA